MKREAEGLNSNWSSVVRKKKWGKRNRKYQTFSFWLCIRAD